MPQSKLSTAARPTQAAVRKALEARGSSVQGLQRDMEQLRRDRDAAQARYEQMQSQYERLLASVESQQQSAQESREGEVLDAIAGMRQAVLDSQRVQIQRLEGAISDVSQPEDEVGPQLLARLEDLSTVVSKNKRYEFDVVRDEEGFIQRVDAHIVDS